MLVSGVVAVVFIVGTVMISWAVYFGMRRVMGEDFAEDTQTLAGSVIIRVAALHGLILALVFAQELVDYTQLQGNLTEEATAIADVWNDAGRYGEAVAAEVQPALRRYTQLVIHEEWEVLARTGRLAPEGWQLREVIYQAVLDLDPATPRESDLRAHMVHKAQAIAELRQARENTALHAVNPLFWLAALAGLVLVAVPYFVFSPTRLHMVLLSVYGAFSGLVMFVIYAFSDPFAAPGVLEPLAFERLLETEIGQQVD
ncbi:hypothetical protein [Sagittula sp. S175]|uniref:bestrophin-like domain n=1 Tax=Sagittula sp. S175 TaxID=3415129 RepID=UPI003C7C7A1C